MKVTYERDKVLNVRKEPNRGAEIVRTINPFEPEDAVEVVDGWCRLRDGYADASLLRIEDGSTAEFEPDEAVEPGEAEEADPHGEEAANLLKMTKADLVELAEGSGVEVSKSMTKADIVTAVLNG